MPQILDLVRGTKLPLLLIIRLGPPPLSQILIILAFRRTSEFGYSTR